MNGEKIKAYRLLIGKPLERPRCGWVDNIRMELAKIGWGDVDWICLAQDRDRWSSCECRNEPSGSIACWETIKWLHNWEPLE
jgi:hypothetical protein